MNDQSVIDIQKHNNKINRILNKICDKNPGLSQQIDLALYSCLKIDKIIKKHIQQNPLRTQGKQNKKYGQENLIGFQSEQDQLYENAINVIEGFKAATKKLQNKVGVLLRQQQINRKVQRAKHHNDIDPYYQVPKHQIFSQNYTVKNNKKKYPSTYEKVQPFSPNIVASSQSKRKTNILVSSDSKNKSSKSKQHQRIQQYINESQSFQEMQNENSKNISQLDQEIIDLASQIKHIIKRQ